MRARNRSTSPLAMLASVPPVLGEWRVVVHQSSKSSKVRSTVIDVPATSTSPAPVHSACIASAREASTLGGRGNVAPSARISACIEKSGNPPPCMSHRYAAQRPPGATTRAISATPLAGSGTKNSTSAITATSNASSR